MSRLNILNTIGLIIALVSGTACAGSDPVIDVFILAGQSNMVGGAQAEKLDETLQPFVQPNSNVTTRTWLNGEDYGDGWEPLQPRGRSKSYGPEMMAGYVLSDVHQDRNLAFMKIAYNGTNLGCAWHPSGCGQNLYAKMASLVDDWKEELEDQGWSVRFAGFIWVQGEGDCTADWSANSYGKNLQLLIDGVRDFTGNGDLAVVVAKVAPRGSGYPYVNTVHQGIETVSTQDAKLAAVTCEAIELKDDQVHFSSHGMIMLGSALADTLLALDPFELSQEVPVCQSDINGDGDVNVIDILLMISNFGPCP
ncbi:MAG: sialate O-acetylesterase [Planctomycetota bacterium]|nr:sialate O-acetylesterase [Planctomycetota bacterium]